MYCTVQELKDYIEQLQDYIIDINLISQRMINGIRESKEMPILVKKGLFSLIDDIKNNVELYQDLHKDVSDFNLTELENKVSAPEPEQSKDDFVIPADISGRAAPVLTHPQLRSPGLTEGMTGDFYKEGPYNSDRSW
jgi:hypothetical protein